MIAVWLVPRASLQETRERLLGGRTVTREAGSKPTVAGLHFNVSHSGDRALIAICHDSPVGIDLEAMRSVRRARRIAQRLCTERELEHLETAASFERALLRLWVRKEAVAKADGGGIGLLLSERIDVLDPIVAGRWLVHDLTLDEPDYAAALAWRA